MGDLVRSVSFATVAHPESQAAEAWRSKDPSHEKSEVITDPAQLVLGRRYAITDVVHPERAGAVGSFDGIRPSDWEGKEPEEYIYVTDGKIGEAPQGSLGFPVAQRREFRVL